MMNKYFTIEQKVKKIVNTIAGVDYLFMDWSQANVALDNIQKPTIVYVLPPSGTLTISALHGRVYDKPETTIAILSPTDFDFDGGENDNVLEGMKRIAVQLIRAINDSDDFENISGDVDYQVVYDHLDVNLTGIMLTLTLEETEGLSLCGDIQRSGDTTTEE